MTSIKVKQYVKLGTTLRYLIDVKEGEPLGGNHILQNIETVILLTNELGFNSTSGSSGITQLKELLVILKSASLVNTVISKEQSEQLERICRKIRDSLLTEGDAIEVVNKDASATEKRLEDPEKVTLSWLFTHVPVPLWLAFVGLLVAVYSFGVKTSHYEIVRDIYKLEPVNKQPATKIYTEHSLLPTTTYHREEVEIAVPGSAKLYSGELIVTTSSGSTAHRVGIVISNPQIGQLGGWTKSRGNELAETASKGFIFKEKPYFVHINKIEPSAVTITIGEKIVLTK